MSPWLHPTWLRPGLFRTNSRRKPAINLAFDLLEQRMLLTTTYTYIFDTAGTFSWTAPTGVTTVSAKVWGGGGGGGGGNGGGGGGGGYSGGTVNVTPGNSYTVIVGVGGAAPTLFSDGGDGGDSSFQGIVGGGGHGGIRGNLTNVGGAGGSGGTGDHAGGTGGDGASGTRTPGNGNGGGGGGGAGGTTAAGGNGGNGSLGVGGAAGTGGVTGGGNGGLGGANATTGSAPWVGVAGSAPGGGGGGGSGAGGTSPDEDSPTRSPTIGGAGGPGQIIITYVLNHAPAGSDNTVSTLENQYYTFSAGDFGFSDPNDTPADNFLSVKITTLPGHGTLKNNGVTVSAGQFISVSDIASGYLRYAQVANGHGAPYTSFTFQVKDDGGTANGGADLDASPNTMNINVTGVPFIAGGDVIVGFEQFSISAVVARFTDGLNTGTYTATILWGDGRTSFGSFVPDGSVMNVVGSHSYERPGPYPVAVKIFDADDSDFAIAGSLIEVLPLDDHARIQNVLSANVTYSGTLLGSTTISGSTYTSTGAGSYDYTANIMLDDDLYSTIQATYVGSMSFSLNETGPISFGQASSTIGETGTILVERDTYTADLEGLMSVSEVGSVAINETKTGSGASYTYSSPTLANLTVTENGLYGGLTYERTGTPQYTTLLSESGNYGTGNFTATRLETYASTAWDVSGDIYGDSLDEDETTSGNASFTEAGNMWTGDYTLTGGTSSDGDATETISNATATSETNYGGDPVSTTILKHANWNSYDYDVTQTLLAANGTADVSITDQDATSHESGSGGYANATIHQLGNTSTGNYTLTTIGGAGGSSSGDFTNQLLTGTTTSSGSANFSSTQTGNVSSANYTLSTFGTAGGSSGIPGFNDQQLSGSASTSGNVTTTILRWGNSDSGAFNVLGTVNSTGSSSGSSSDQGVSGSGLLSVLTPTLTTVTSTGNVFSGSYSITSVTTGGSRFSTTSNLSANVAGTATVTSSSASVVTVHEEGNSIAGTYTRSTDVTIPSYSGTWISDNQTADATGTITGSRTSTSDESGDLRAGTYTFTSSSYENGTIVANGTDARGDFDATTTTVTDTESMGSGNSRTGAYSNDVTVTTLLSVTRIGADNDNVFAQTVDATVTSFNHAEGNPVTGLYTANSLATSTVTTYETGDYQDDTSFEITTSIVTESASNMTGNSVTSAYTVSSAHNNVDTTTDATGDDDNGTYVFHKTAYSYESWSTTGNTILGTYTRTGTNTNGSTADETNTYFDGGAHFTEELFENYGFTQTGNSVTGAYTLTKTDGTHTSSLDAVTNNSSGNYTVTQSMYGNFTASTTGNSVTGDYTSSETANDDYTVVETGYGTANFALTMVGHNAYTDEEDGNTVLGWYVRTKNGNDDFSITETGLKSGGAYSQTVAGNETYTLVDNGNPVTGHYTRNIDIDSSTYTRSSSGSGATEPSDTGSTDYHWEQTGDPHSGVFTLSETGTSRYDLLEDFYDISNTQGGQTPGHMNVYPFGQTFVDPGPSSMLIIVAAGQMVGQAPFEDRPTPALTNVIVSLFQLPYTYRRTDVGTWSAWEFNRNHYNKDGTTAGSSWSRTRSKTVTTGILGWGDLYSKTTEETDFFRAICPFDPRKLRNMSPACLPPGRYNVRDYPEPEYQWRVYGR